MSVKLSVAIVVYNHYSDALCAVRTIELFTDKKITKTVYVVDNSSRHDSEQSDFKERLKEYTDVVYFDTYENLGFGKGHNYVLNYLDSEYHAIVNPDIKLKDDAFSAILEYMDSNGVGMSIPRLVDEKGNLQSVYRREITVEDMFIRMFASRFFKKRQAYHTMQECSYKTPFPVPFGQGSFLVVRTEIFRKLNGFDERYFMYMEDADFCKRVNEISQLMYCPYAEVIHKWEKGSHKNMRLLKIHIKSMLKYFHKWGWKFK